MASQLEGSMVLCRNDSEFDWYFFITGAAVRRLLLGQWDMFEREKLASSDRSKENGEARGLQASETSMTVRGLSRFVLHRPLTRLL